MEAYWVVAGMVAVGMMDSLLVALMDSLAAPWPSGCNRINLLCKVTRLRWNGCQSDSERSKILQWKTPEAALEEYSVVHPCGGRSHAGGRPSGAGPAEHHRTVGWRPGGCVAER